MEKVLWLPGWYPNKTDTYIGDFIQRHAKAASLYNAVQVIHVVRDNEGVVTKNVQEEDVENGNLREKIVYYYTPVHPIPFIDKIISARQYARICKQLVKKYISKEGIPLCAHVHIVKKNGLVAVWLKKKYGIPFFVSEQWTIYLPEARPGFANCSRLFKAMWFRIMRAANGLTVVSNYLGNAIRQLKKGTNFTVIPNVVDEFVFFPVIEKKKESVVQFIHISTLGYQKNPEMILAAFGLVKKQNPSFKLSVFGPPKKELQALSNSLGLQQQVTFYNEVPQWQLADFIRVSDALILYSRYETFGCVLIEANACGIPAIVSDIPVFHEIIKEGINGYFVPGEDAVALSEKLQSFINDHSQTTAPAIANAAKENYNYEKIGKQFSELYATLLKT